MVMYQSKDKKVAIDMAQASMCQVGHDKDGRFHVCMILVAGQQINIPIFEEAARAVKAFNLQWGTDLECLEKVEVSNIVVPGNKKIIRPKLELKQPTKR